MANSIRLLGLAKKAGRLEIGEETCGAAARAKKARIILTASDASDNSLQRARNYARTGNIPHIPVPYTKMELGIEVGRGSPGMLAITDIGLAARFVSELARENPELYGDAAAEMAAKNERAVRRKKEAKMHEKNVRMGKRRKTE